MRLRREPRTFPHPLDDRGIALVMALGIMFVLSLTVISAIAYTSSNSRNAAHSKEGTKAQALAEAGLSNARATLWAATDPTDPLSVPEQTVTLEGGTVTYSGSYLSDSAIWTLTGTGEVRNPTGGSPITRTVTSQVSVSFVPEGSGDTAVWNYLFSDATSGCMNVSTDDTIDAPMYVRGNLCLSNDADVTGSPVQVEGTLTLESDSSVGTLESPIADARIDGGCTGGVPDPHICTALDRVYAVLLTSEPDGLAKPSVNLTHWYTYAAPGPSRACTTGSFPGGFDDDSIMNGTRPAVDLMPASAYDCQVLDGNGNLIGRLAWTPGSPGTLQVAGTIFFDGDIAFSGVDSGVYEGRATIYANGRITFDDDVTLCGVSTCDESWDADENLLVLAAGSGAQGGTFAFDFSGAVFQGASYAVGDLREQNDTIVWGPVIANQLSITDDAINRLESIDTFLNGMPGSLSVPLLEDVDGSYSG